MRIATVGATIIASPAIAGLVRASKRNRLRARVADYIQLREELQISNPDSASRLTDAIDEAVATMLTGDQKWMRRRIETSSVLALVILLTPAISLFIWTYTGHHHVWWRVPVLAASAIWAVLWVFAGGSSLFKSDDPRADDDSGVSSRTLRVKRD
jgi:ABC-type transport system involved in cytochrome bd biosynthesis fused ATPase/permease subunit